MGDADEAAQLRADIRALRTIIDDALDHGTPRHFLQAMVEVLTDRRERLDELENAALGKPRRSRA